MTSFNFRVYNNRKGNNLNYTIRKTPSGWHFSHIAINGDCKPNGDPFVKMNLDQDYIQHPGALPASLEWVWEQIHHGNIELEEAQDKIQELADWVTACEQNRPQWAGWNC